MTKKRSSTRFPGDSFVHLLMLSLVLVVLTGLTAGRQLKVPAPVEIARVEASYQLTPVFFGESSYPQLSAQAAYVMDVGSDTPLYEKNIDEGLLPASTTKIMTALIALEEYDKADIVTVGKINIEGQKMKLYEGEQINAHDLISALLVFSANDAAEVLAASIPGGRSVFIQKMNAKALELGLTNSLFTNPSGLDGDSQLITAADLYKLSLYAMQQPEFARIVGQKMVEIESVDHQYAYKLPSTNVLLGQVEGVLGVKTGYTDAARENLVTYVERGDKKIMFVVMGSQDRFGETKELIDWVFANYRWERSLVYSP